MKVLLACEESQICAAAFRLLGHNAHSCDLLPPSGGHPEYHIQGDVFELLEETPGVWDLVIAFPPCTDLAASGARWFPRKIADGSQARAIDFFMRFTRLDSIPRVAIENPVGIMSTHYRKPDQIIHPWMFGHGEMKATCLWLKGLPPLMPTFIVDGRDSRIHKMPGGKNQAYLRSKTYPGIALAMAEQWGGLIDHPS